MKNLNKEPVYGQLYKLEGKIHRKSLNSIWLDESYIILNKENESDVKYYGCPVDITPDTYWKYISQLFTDTVYGLMYGKDTNIVLDNIINNEVHVIDGLLMDGLLMQLPVSVITNAKIFKNMRFPHRQQTIRKGSLLCCPGQKNEYWLYLGNDEWLLPNIGFGYGKIIYDTVITEGLSKQLEEQVNVLGNKKTVVYDRAVILDSGVLVMKIDLNTLNL